MFITTGTRITIGGASMSDHKVDIQLDSGVAIEVKGDMRDKLVANLRSQARQSSAARQARAGRFAHRPVVARAKRVPTRSGAVTTRISMVEGEPQAVLIKNRSEDLAKDVIRLRSRYAKLLTEESDS